MNHFKVEFYYQNEKIATRDFSEAIFSPFVGESLLIEFHNHNILDEYGPWWQVTERKILFFPQDHEEGLKQTLMLNVKPDPDKGKWHNNQS